MPAHATIIATAAGTGPASTSRFVHGPTRRFNPLERPRPAIALLLCGIGLYWVMAAAIRAQRRELGVRIALGASPRDIGRLVLADAARIVGTGAGIGLVIALLAGRLLESQLFGIQPTDPVSMRGACLALFAIALIAVCVPASRATRVDPIEVLGAD